MRGSGILPRMDISDPTSASPLPANDTPAPRRVDDHLWQQLAPILALDQPRKKRGRPRCDDRRIVDGLLWLAYTGAEWADLPAEFGSKSTCNKRLQEWIERGVFAEAWALLVATYADLAELNWSWLVPDGNSSAAPAGRKGLWALRKRPDVRNVAAPPTAYRGLHPARGRQSLAAA